MSNRKEVEGLRATLKAIRYEIQHALGTDRNPSRADLYRIDRIASEALKGEE